MKAILLVGQAPSRTSDPREPFSGRSGARLVAYSGLDREGFWSLVDAANLLNYWPGQSRPKGDDFSLPEARVAAMVLTGRISIRVPRYALMILAGRKVAAAFGLDWLDWFEEYAIGELTGLDGDDAALSAWVTSVKGGLARVAVIPHPSGANYWWNQPANVELAQRKLREWVR